MIKEQAITCLYKTKVNLAKNWNLKIKLRFTMKIFLQINIKYNKIYIINERNEF